MVSKDAKFSLDVSVPTKVRVLGISLRKIYNLPLHLLFFLPYFSRLSVSGQAINIPTSV
jgi:hypothetical protein